MYMSFRPVFGRSRSCAFLYTGAYLRLMFICTTATPFFSFFFFSWSGDPRDLHSFPTRRSSDLSAAVPAQGAVGGEGAVNPGAPLARAGRGGLRRRERARPGGGRPGQELRGRLAQTRAPLRPDPVRGGGRPAHPRRRGGPATRAFRRLAAAARPPAFLRHRRARHGGRARGGPEVART